MIYNCIRHGQSNLLTSTDYLVDSNRNYAQVLVERVNGAADLSYHFGDDLISQSRAQTSHYFHTDGLGSTRVLTDITGSVSDRYAYSAFGEKLTETGSTDTGYLYTGEQFDSVLEQYYLRARYYNVGLAQMTSMDTYLGQLADPTSLQKYLYVKNNPVSFTDPSGNITLQGLSSSISAVPRLALRTSGNRIRKFVGKEEENSFLFGDPPDSFGLVGEFVLDHVSTIIYPYIGLDLDALIDSFTSPAGFGTALHQELENRLNNISPFQKVFMRPKFFCMS